MLRSSAGKVGYVVFIAGMFLLARLISDMLFYGLDVISPVLVLTALVLGIIGFLILMRDPYARSKGWRVIRSATLFSSRRGKWGYYLTILGLFVLMIVLLPEIYRRGPAPDFLPVLALAIVSLIIGLALLLSEQPDRKPPT